jgi:cytochrome c oxidase assembly factor CtaG
VTATGWLDLLARWDLEPVLTAALAGSAAGYVAAARRAAGWHAGATASFLAGILVLAVALESGLHAEGEALLSVHMVQHLLLTLVVPPLLVLGRPLAVLLRGGPVAARRPLADLVRARPAAVLGHPLTALGLFCAVLVATHAPAFYDAALRHQGLHDLEHVLYLASALVFWQVVLAPEPHPHAASPIVRMLLVLAAMVPMAVVGVGLLVPTSVVYPTYARTAPAHGVAALADQQEGGSIMWLWGTLALAVAVMVAGWWAVVREHRRRLALEAALERAAGGVS